LKIDDSYAMFRQAWEWPGYVYLPIDCRTDLCR
jgi:hypothetical protein